MNIYTLTLNPSVDYSFYVPSIKFDDINRITHQRIDPGGKGVNIARMLLKLGEKSIPITFCTKDNSNIYPKILEKEGLIPIYIKIKEKIRNVYNFISEKGEILRFNEKGPKISYEEKKQLFKKIMCLDYKKGDIIAISGSLPSGFKKDTYKVILNKLKKFQLITFVDADGDVLKYAVESSPYIIKPNLWELERCIGEKIKNGRKLVSVIGNLLNKNISIIILTLGEKGTFVFTKEQILYGNVPKVKVKSSVGCGDAFIAGFLFSLKNNKNLKDCLKCAIACGTGKTKQEGTKMPDKKEVMGIYNKTTILDVDYEWVLKNFVP